MIHKVNTLFDAAVQANEGW